MGSRPTILDVARAAGVSKSTVSNVIREAPGISPSTRRRVLDAVAQVGYRPNAIARNLVQRHTRTVGIVVGDLANPFYSELAKLVERRVSAAGYTTMICNTDGSDDNERRRVEALLEHRVAGIVMLQLTGESAIVPELRSQAVPLIVVSCWEEGSDCVAVDDMEGAMLAVRHLVELGHQRIAYLSSSLVESRADADRFEGYRSAMAAAGLEKAERTAVRWERPAYLRRDPHLLNEIARLVGSEAPPTAFFVSNDLVAVDLIEAVEQLGLRVPENVSVVGFDDIALAGLARVSLTTVSQPREELARVAVQILLERVRTGEALPFRHVRLRPKLVVRGSTAPVYCGDPACVKASTIER
jgi:LacI family transcriptional regulator, galactose operon repressor